ncbi:MAG: cobalamin biosynthesis protein [Kineosporiaceae bacterium]
MTTAPVAAPPPGAPVPERPVGLVAVTAAGRRHAAVLAAAWPDALLVDEGSAAASLAHAWTSCRAVVAFLATGAVVRLVAPLLADKRTDPPLVTVDEAGRFAVALTGGHAGANSLADAVATLLGATSVVTTGSDARGLPGLDTLGMPVEGDVAAVSRAVLDGEPVRLVADAVHPLPALPPSVRADAADAVAVLRVADRRDDPTSEFRGDGVPVAVLRPATLVVGVGGSRGVSAQEVEETVRAALDGAGLSPASVRALATADVKADEEGIVTAAARLGVPLVTWPAEVLAAVEVPHPSEVVRAAVGTPSVAEAAALLGDRPRQPALPGDAELVVPKLVSAGASPMATAAVARHRPRGRLAVVGLGPGARDLLTPRAVAELRRASVVVGLDQYVDQVRDLLRPGTRVLATGLGAEEERARSAVEEARAGHAVALVGSGDAGVYAMASPALDVAGEDIDVVGVPGVTAALAAAAVLGAPLGHDHLYLSLSDLHTPWEAIEARARAAAEADLVVLLYNPRSRARHWQLGHVLDVLRAHRPRPPRWGWSATPADPTSPCTWRPWRPSTRRSSTCTASSSSAAAPPGSSPAAWSPPAATGGAGERRVPRRPARRPAGRSAGRRRRRLSGLRRLPAHLPVPCPAAPRRPARRPALLRRLRRVRRDLPRGRHRPRPPRSVMTSPTLALPTRWSRGERARIVGILAVIAALHLAGWTMYLAQAGSPAAAGGLAGAGTLAYVLGIRHAFDADHIAAIDDTTRLMLLRGRRPVGVGFFFALGHSSVVLILALVVAVAAGAVSTRGMTQLQEVGGVVALVVATSFLLLVAVLNAVVLTGLARLWRSFRTGALATADLDAALLNRGLLNRVLGPRARLLVRSSWHMAPVGFLFGLGLETASEVTLLSLSASTAAGGGLPVIAVLSLPVLFAAGMTGMDTVDSLLMARAYSWAYRSPGRRLYYNLATTAITVAVGVFVASVYAAGLAVDHLGVTALAGYAALGTHFELFGYAIVGVFLTAWLAATLVWRLRGYEARYGGAA